MTTNKLLELAERLERIDNEGFHRASYNDCKEAAAALRQMAEQKPVAWRSDDWKIVVRDHEHAYWMIANNPLYAAPVAQPSKEWLDEAMRLADFMVLMRPATAPQQSDAQLMAQAIELEKARAALREHLEKR